MRLQLPFALPLKRLLPRGLFGRSLLIVLVPLIALQIVAYTIFYGSHLELVSRRLSAAVAGEIAETAELLERYPSAPERRWTLRHAWLAYEIPMRLTPGVALSPHRHVNVLGPMDDDLAAALRAKVGRPFTMDWTSNPLYVVVRVQLQDGVLEAEAPRKQLFASALYIFLAWLLGSAVVLFGVAALFLRNQVRAIRRLSEAADAFGKGRDPGPLKPEGASEVRQAATAFNRMRERLLRFVQQRTEMLAGVSHDLRTPLTRLRLALAMLPFETDVVEMTADVAEMDRMIEGYLAFARGEGEEAAQAIDLAALLDEVAGAARRAGAAVECEVPDTLPMTLRSDAVRRALTNVVDNARRHARRVLLAAQRQGRNVVVTVDDDGPGIPADRRELVFRPFESGAHGGTGLGLSIARDIVRAHGGDIELLTSPLGGLRARIRLPA